MFYLKEIFFRIRYIFVSFFLTIAICYHNRDLLFFLLTFNFLFPNSNKNVSQSGVEYLIYTHPSELFSTYIVIILYFTLMIMAYHFAWNILDFMRSSLKRSEFRLFDNGVFRIVLVLCSLNILLLLFLFPSYWNFFASFNETPIIDTTLKFFLELKVKDYIAFLKSLLYTTNVGLVLSFLFFSFLHSQDFRKLLYWKKFYLLFNFIFSAIYIPSDVLCQIINILLLNILVELIILIRIIKLKSKKQILSLNVQ